VRVRREGAMMHEREVAPVVGFLHAHRGSVHQAGASGTVRREPRRPTGGQGVRGATLAGYAPGARKPAG
jgi:hypothetical protein